MIAPPENPYRLSEDKILAPPRGWRHTLSHLGPGFILSASIVGSGELIATTRLGAEAGFITLWVVLVSCLVKVAVQLEFGKFAIYSGRTTMEALNDLPGPRIGKANWSIWAWLLIMSLKFLQVGGIVGGVALLLFEISPLVGGIGGQAIWAALIVTAVALLICRGSYRPIERWSLVMIGLFTVFTVICVISLQWTPMRVTGSELGSGLTFHLPPEALLVAIGVFGITGVGGDEIMAYNYWLIEKGYAAHTGPRGADPSPQHAAEWTHRARGWIRVMTWDAVASMVCYTVVTGMFYLLGAAVLHRKGIIPESSELVGALASMYTDSLGPWAYWVFLLGALVVLFSTLLAALAAWTRMFADAFGQIGLLDFHDVESRRRWIGIFAWVFPTIWAILFFIFQRPSFMVIVGGFATAVILLIVVFAALVMRYRWLPESLRPTRLYDTALWLSILAIAGVGAYSIWTALPG